MSRKLEFVQLEAGEDVASVRDRLSFMRGQRVLIVWPEQGTALTRKLDLVLIQRDAMRRAIRLALVTHDPVVIEHARELNISTFETIGASERGRWKRGRSKVFISRFQRPRDEPEPEELMDVASRVRLPEETTSRLWRAGVRAAVVALLVGVTGLVAYVVVPGATVLISLAREDQRVEAEITADPSSVDVDIEQAIMPATRLLVEIETSGTVPATGTHTLPDVLAEGAVIFINQTNREVEIPAGTVVSTGAGTPIQFRTTQDATLAAGVGQQLEVPIEALPDSSGDVGNVASGLINTVTGPLESSVTVRNIAPTVGGESRTVPSVTVEDRERLVATVRQQLQSQAYLAMLQQLSPTQMLIVETLRVAEEREDWTTFSARPGDVTDTVSLTMRALVEGIAIDAELGQQIAFAQMSALVPRGSVIRQETVTYECCTVIGVEEGGRIRFKITGSGQVAGQVNTGLLRERLAGRSVEDAVRYLATELDLAPGTAPQITVSPDWLGQMPVLPIRIDVRLVDI